jgi:tight adherence protein C
MLIIKGLSLFLTILVLGTFLIIMYTNYFKYSEYTSALNPKEYIFRRLLPFGLYLLDRFGYSFNSSYDRKTIYKISEIFGQEYSSFYVRVFHANKIVLLTLMLPCELLVGIFSDFQIVFQAYVSIFFAAMVFMDDLRLGNKIKKRRLTVQLEFPNFINKLTLLLNAGLTMSKAWEKIAEDSDNAGDFYSEVHKTVCEIKSGVSESEAFGQFAKRLKTPEVSRFISLIIQNTKKGGKDLVLSLRLQSSECWEMRKNAIKKLGEEASTKLLLPMMIMFFAIIIIVVIPAVISMQNISNL